MGIVTRFVRWTGHDAAGTLPPLDVVAGIVRSDVRRVLEWWPPLGPDESLVLVPPQWIGDWENGHTLAPAYQYLWYAPMARLSFLSGIPEGTPYRPDRLPPSATGPRHTSKDSWRPNR